MATPSVVSKFNPLRQYRWGKNCEAWNLVDTNEMSVKLESMPSGAEEVLHYHKQSQQFFFILKGKAVFEINNVILMVHEGEGLHVEAGQKHRIMNKQEKPLEFIVYSHPSTDSDRYNLV